MVNVDSALGSLTGEKAGRGKTEGACEMEVFCSFSRRDLNDKIRKCRDSF